MDKLEDKDFLFYRSPKTGEVIVRVALIEDQIWATQKGMGIIFNTSRQNIAKHLKNIFESGELSENSVCNQKLHTALDGKEYAVKVYNLDSIIAVGYRVNSYEATQFRIWATRILKEYLIKGFVMDDERLKRGNELFGKDYFSELLERIREIRASERRFYQKVTDLYKNASLDYDKDSPVTKQFYQIVQNKLLFAITGKTAAEIIKSRVDADKENMGLTSWKGKGIDEKILSSDITVSKNYLKETELKELNRIVSMFLDYAENLVERQITMTMADWAKTLDDFLSFNRYDSLKNAGKVSKKTADDIARRQFKKFRKRQDIEYISDFDKAIIEVKSGRVPRSEMDLIEDADVQEEPLSDFNQKLKKALSFNPKK